MKKIINLFVIGIMALFVACSGGSSPEEIHNKIQSAKKLSEADYSVMVDYVINGSTEMMGLLENVSDEEEYDSKINSLNNKYPYVLEFIQELNQNMDQLSPSDKKKIDKLNEEFLGGY